MEKTLQHDQATQLIGIPTTGTTNVHLPTGGQCLKEDKN